MHALASSSHVCIHVYPCSQPPPPTPLRLSSPPSSSASITSPAPTNRTLHMTPITSTQATHKRARTFLQGLTVRTSCVVCWCGGVGVYVCFVHDSHAFSSVISCLFKCCMHIDMHMFFQMDEDLPRSTPSTPSRMLPTTPTRGRSDWLKSMDADVTLAATPVTSTPTRSAEKARKKNAGKGMLGHRLVSAQG